MQNSSDQNWQVCDRFLELHSRWMTLIGEHLQTPEGQLLEYWRIEKADSVIVLPLQPVSIQTDSGITEETWLLLPSPSYRPGVGRATLDFPGGRIGAGQSLEEAAIATLQRELGIEAAAITQLTALNSEGWSVNSSFSNQKLYGFVAHLHPTTEQLPEQAAIAYPATPTGVQHLLQELTCLQCRAVLLEWWRLNG